MKKPTSYETAFAELQTILQAIQSEETGIDDLRKQLDRARVLIDFCQGKLRDLEDATEGFGEDEG